VNSVTVSDPWLSDNRGVEPSAFDELAFFRAVQASGAQALLIGRRALVLLGLPVLTADYDFWVAIDHMAEFDEVGKAFGLVPTRTPDDARQRGRYALENDEHVDVLVARSVTTVEGRCVEFASVWERRRAITLRDNVIVCIPAVEDLILTKQVASRPKDLEDIRLLRALGSDTER
jgi:hypothetical protein